MAGFGIGGIGSGIDWGALVDASIKGDLESLQRTIGRREVFLNAERTVFSQLQGGMGALRTSINAFKSSGGFQTKTFTSSDTSVVTGAAGPNAGVQSAKIEVLSLATNASARLKATSTDAVVNSGEDTTIKFNVRGSAKEIEVPEGTTLSELATLINNSNSGVTATVYNTNDGTDNPVRLVITDNMLGKWDAPSGDDSGEDPVEDPEAGNNIQFVNFASVLDGIEADPEYLAPESTVVRINGEEIVRNNHVVSDVLPGVTLNLNSAKPGEEITINIGESTSGAKAAMKKMIDSYNEVYKFLAAALKSDPAETTQKNPTAGSSSLRSIMTQLQSAMTAPIYGSGGTKFNSLTDIGVTTIRNDTEAHRNGQLELDEAKFDSLVKSDFDDMVAFFEGFVNEEGKKEGGFAHKMEDLMKGFLQSGSGAIPAKIASLNSSIARVTKDKERRLEQIQRKETRMVERFARLESQLAALGSQQGQLESAIQSMNNTSSFIANRGRR